MARDYAPKTRSKYKKRRGSSRARTAPSMSYWMTTFLVIAAFIAALAYLRHQGTLDKFSKHPVAQTVQKKQASYQKRAHKKTYQPVKPRFEFYTLLPQDTVHVNKQREHKSEVKPSVRQAETPTPIHATKPRISSGKSLAPVVAAHPSPVKTILQFGSFKSFTDADHLKAILTLQGLSVTIEPIQLNGQTLYRVYSGPYTSAEHAKKLQAELQSGNPDIKSIVRRV